MRKTLKSFFSRDLKITGVLIFSLSENNFEFLLQCIDGGERKRMLSDVQYRLIVRYSARLKHRYCSWRTQVRKCKYWQVKVRGMAARRKIELLGRGERRKGGCYTSVSDVLNTVSKERRSILAPRSITRAVKSAPHALTTTSSCKRPLLREFSRSMISRELRLSRESHLQSEIA